MKSPFKFLDAFELKDRDVFFGRHEETDALYAMVFKTPLLLVYGLSGTGKTSLIQCGLAGRFAGPNWFPFPIRRGDDINASIRKAFEPVIPENMQQPAALHETVSLLFRYYLRPVYLIFDQFEELFILGSREEQMEFARSIRDLLRADLPSKIIFVMREEFIGQLYYLEKEIPSIYDFRLRVEPMGFKKVQEVITGSFSAFHISLEAPEENMERMYANISAGKSGVQLPYLQVYLDMLWREDFARTYPGVEAETVTYPSLTLSSQEIQDFGAIEDVLARFLREQERELSTALQEKFPDTPTQSVRSLLDAFVTEEGTKRPIRFQREGKLYVPEEKSAELLPKMAPAALTFLLDKLENSRLLRERDGALELAHDALAALIDGERTREQRALNELKSRLNSAIKEFQFSDGTEYPSKKLLLDVEEKMQELQLNNEQRAFFESSQKEWQRRDNFEREEAEKRALEAEQRYNEELTLRTQAEQARRRARWLAIAAGIIAVFAIVAGIMAYQSSLEANAQKAEANRNLVLANESKAEAEKQTNIANDNAKLASEKETLAKNKEQEANASAAAARNALADFKNEQSAKERLQFKSKAAIVENFLRVKHCKLAQSALEDLEKIAQKYPAIQDMQTTVKSLKSQVAACESGK